MTKVLDCTGCENLSEVRECIDEQIEDHGHAYKYLPSKLLINEACAKELRGMISLRYETKELHYRTVPCEVV
jgi:hypothetical protein